MAELEGDGDGGMLTRQGRSIISLDWVGGHFEVIVLLRGRALLDDIMDIPQGSQLIFVACVRGITRYKIAHATAASALQCDARCFLGRVLLRDLVDVSDEPYEHDTTFGSHMPCNFMSAR
jgi:hypothetical protein